MSKKREFLVISSGWKVEILDDKMRLFELNKNDLMIKEICLDAPKFRFKCEATNFLDALALFTDEVQRRKDLEKEVTKISYLDIRNNLA